MSSPVEASQTLTRRPSRTIRVRSFKLRYLAVETLPPYRLMRTLEAFSSWGYLVAKKASTRSRYCRFSATKCYSDKSSSGVWVNGLLRAAVTFRRPL